MKNFLGLIEKSDFQEGRGLMKNQYKGEVGELPNKGGLNSFLKSRLDCYTTSSYSDDITLLVLKVSIYILDL